MCGCPHCGFVFQVKRRLHDDPPGANVQCCPKCFQCLDADKEPTWLEQPKPTTP